MGIIERTKVAVASVESSNIIAMFEIRPEDIAQLDDGQLRRLIGLLCEAELRKHGFSIAAVTYGGDQTASDGGLDVRVSLPEDQAVDGFIPRRATGFQVKSQDMPARAITREMCPKGLLRPVIAELARNHGAYIIVSSKGSTSDSALESRRKAMRAAARGESDELALDFYDRTRLASWVRCHAGLVVWVRAEIGRAIEGWEPFGAWAYREGGTEAEYLTENGVRIVALSTTTRDGLPADVGLGKIRQILRNAGGVVRLVGLSGVGKTRFAQALFDARIGDDALDPALAVYTNISNDPNPQPFHLASDLMASGMRAILIVDNCGADLHSRLTQLVRTGGSSLSVLTIEYDIQDDQPEGTEVFEVEAASVELIRALLQKRFPELSQVDAQTAAEFSGGNARIAIALAEAGQRGGPLGSLSDAQLFERLFDQRRGSDKSLLRTAEACSLIYSFDGEDLSDGQEGELARIARMAGTTAEGAYRQVAELLRRDLAQRRGKWRAVLPHALANRLAAAALQNIPYSVIESCLMTGAPERLVKSFARRLGYLDKSPKAKDIVHGWFEREGWLGPHVWNLSEFGKEVFRHCLPADPEGGLWALEVGLPSYGSDEPIITSDYVARALRSLAWDAALFERCLRLLEIIAVYGEGKTSQEAANRHKSLFYLYLSGTHASTAQRAQAVRRLLSSKASAKRGLGLSALRAMLEATHFSSDYDFQFGGRSRDYGYHPRTWEEFDRWYKTGLELAVDVALSDSLSAEGARNAIAAKFRGLWYRKALRDELENVVARLAAKDFWREGWRAVKQTRLFDAKDKASDEYARLSKLEVMLRPRDLRQRVRGIVFMSAVGISDFDDVDLHNPDSFRVDMERKNDEAVRLGVEVGKDEAMLREFLPEIVGGEGNLFHFGRGLARGSSNPEKVWDSIVEELARTSLSSRDVGALCGVLWELSAATSDLPDKWLDHAIDQPQLAPYFPVLQGALVVNARGINRLIRSLETGKASIESYRNIRLGSGVPMFERATLPTICGLLRKHPAVIALRFIVLVCILRMTGRISARMPLN